MTNKCVVAVITSFCAFERLGQVNKGGIGVQVFCPSGASRKYHTCYTPVSLKASMVDQSIQHDSGKDFPCKR